MKAHARSVAPALPYVSYTARESMSEPLEVKRHDSLTSALFYFEANNAVRNAYVKNRAYNGWPVGETWEVYAESMVHDGATVYMGQIEKET